MRAAFLALTLASPAAALEVRSVQYVCERGVVVHASYATATTGAAVILSIEGRQIALMQVPAASGLRYESPTAAEGYIWYSRGTEARLDWRGASGAITLFEECTSE